MTEQDFTDALILQLSNIVAPCEIATKVNLLYNLSIDDYGNLHNGLDTNLQAKRGGGTGFEQDILVFETVTGAFTSIVPRVIAEVKVSKGITTHSVLAYAEKARRIRTVYPYVRYGLIMGGKKNIPPRAIRLGQEFDFMTVMTAPALETEVEALGILLKQEIQASRHLAHILPGKLRITQLRRVLELLER